MKTYWLKFFILAFVFACLVKPVYPQFYDKDTLFHPYHVNYLVTGSIILGGITLEKIRSEERRVGKECRL